MISIVALPGSRIDLRRLRGPNAHPPVPAPSEPPGLDVATSSRWAGPGRQSRVAHSHGRIIVIPALLVLAAGVIWFWIEQRAVVERRRATEDQLAAATVSLPFRGRRVRLGFSSTAGDPSTT